MKIHLCDRLWNRFSNPPSAWHRALSTKATFDSSTACAANHPPAVHAAYADTDAVVFVHTEFPHEWKEKANEAAVSCHIIFVRSDGGEAAQVSNKGNLHGCFWSPDQVEKGALSEIVELTKRISGGESDWHKFLQPTSVPEKVLSWALLEAYGNGVEGAAVLKDKIRDEAEAELRERAKNPSLALSPETARDEIARYREDI